ncbi:pantoate--beta-alanine ligase [Labrys wisconsinensis]|uniref:Pantothenate synthetase n=1 Tax=Labrys wisconsinensis TaxID=425677 RepID=A0ABU0J552_9HYPH|nr:pantoate--beta-alanine ligase [Labrys wisconsinensis]MDQ0468317.1 pantoate--beta-alanine ligase [Labrys wisconsinensis]
MAITIVRTVAALRSAVAALRRGGGTIGLVPTMGALHDGHIALVERGRREADHVAASIFVNPTQFAVGEDLALYPRTEAADLARLEAAGTALAFIPAPEEMYPAGFATTVSLAGPAAAGLEDRFRPTHFAGVATVVAKLFVQSQADIAVFGEKDYQQLMVVTRMARDLDLPIRVVGAPTVREADGLAMSSRNRYLAPDERAAAPVLHRVLAACARTIRGGGHAGAALAEGREAIERAGFALDYLEARQAESLAPLADGTGGPIRLLVAARIGKTRLIDNLGV